MTLEEQLGFAPVPRGPVSLVGSGGKTTLLYLLARRYAKKGCSVAVTTTTHIVRPSEYAVCTEDTPKPERGRILVCGTPAPQGKLSAPKPETLALLCANADILLIEADGSKRLPLKFPAAHEPVVLPQTAHIVAVLGLSALGRPLGAVCHRAELVAEQLGYSMHQIVTPELAAQILYRGYGGIAGLSVLLNQADSPALLAVGKQVADRLCALGIARTVCTSLQQEELIEC